MSRHSKNNTSQSIFTYGQKKKLKGQYGTIQSRISQDSIKKFEMCTICNHEIVEPVCCTHGHVFCRQCAIEYMVKQKKKIVEMKQQALANEKRVQQNKQHKKLEQSVKKAVEFEKYDNFENLVSRTEFSDRASLGKNEQKISAQQSKPVGVYEITGQKQKYVKSSFWAIENTPNLETKINSSEISDVVKCAGGSDHKLTLKKLRPLIVRKLQIEYCCGICSKQIRRQKIGSYKCGHVICSACKSEKCELCGKMDGWIEIESSSSSFAEHRKAEVKTYTHAFYT